MYKRFLNIFIRSFKSQKYEERFKDIEVLLDKTREGSTGNSNKIIEEIEQIKTHVDETGASLHQKLLDIEMTQTNEVKENNNNKEKNKKKNVRRNSEWYRQIAHCTAEEKRTK